MTNALKFTPPGGGIDVRVRRAGDTAHVTVADDGAGIPADLLPHIFEEFRQGRAAPGGTGDARPGLGLGLAIVRRLVEIHGGRVGARSEGPGHGATFLIELPAAGARAVPATAHVVRRCGDVAERPV